MQFACNTLRVFAPQLPIIYIILDIKHIAYI